MPRTPTVTRDQVPEALRDAFDAETADTGGVVTSGPGSVMIHSPEMRRRANNLVNYLRDESSLSKKLQELTMILAARTNDCQFIWHAHAGRARQLGISDEFVDNLRDGKPLPQLPADETDRGQLCHRNIPESPGYRMRRGRRAVDQFRADGGYRVDHPDGLLHHAGLQC